MVVLYITPDCDRLESAEQITRISGTLRGIGRKDTGDLERICAQSFQ
jgi:hypothetical protein